jgi:hypothetical protein
MPAQAGIRYFAGNSDFIARDDLYRPSSRTMTPWFRSNSQHNRQILPGTGTLCRAMRQP